MEFTLKREEKLDLPNDKNEIPLSIVKFLLLKVGARSSSSSNNYTLPIREIISSVKILLFLVEVLNVRTEDTHVISLLVGSVDVVAMVVQS